MVVLPGFGLLLRGRPQVMGVNVVVSIAVGGDDSIEGRRPRRQLRAAARSIGRQLVDVVICHPIAAVAAVAARLFGWSVARCLLVAAVLDQTIPFVAARNSTAPARFLRLWALACRFRRRWPRSLAAAGTALQRHVYLEQAGTGAVDATANSHRPTRRPPALARLPHRIEGSTVAWRLDVTPNDDPAELDGRLRSLSLIDPRILSAELERRPDHDDDRHGGFADPSWDLVVDFDIEPPSWYLSVLDRGRAFVSIGPPPRQRHQHEEGGHHGNG